MTKQESIKLFRDMWRSMYEHITEIAQPISIPWYKLSYLMERRIICENDCPLCEYTKSEDTKYHCSICCAKCPIDWESTATSYMCEYASDDTLILERDGLWWKANKSTDWKEQAELCLKISQLPEKD